MVLVWNMAIWEGKSNLGLHIGITVFHNHDRDYLDGKYGADSSLFSNRIYTRINYRFLRIEYTMSMYAGMSIVMNLKNGISFCPSTTILFPIGNKAFYLQPLYETKDKQLNVQTGIHFIIN